jgi:alkylation response protein AidB-like acyl-CoA dehydrogenase
VRTTQKLSPRSFSSVATAQTLSPLLGLNEDQSSFYSLAREFADNEMKPFAQEWDEKGEFPLDVYKKCAELGFAGIFVNDDVGGTGLSRVDTVTIVEGLATGCVGTTAMLTIHNMCAGMIDKFGSQEHREAYLPGMCNMDIKASYCLTEPGSGSDASSLMTKAILDPETHEYVLNGGKAFISGAGMSDLYLVMCRTGNDGPKGISCMLVPSDAPGLLFGANEKKMGWKVQPTKQVIFEDCRIPADNLLGTEGQGFKMAMAGLDGGRLSIGACSLGAAQACFELALDYAKERKQFGQRVADNQAIQFKLADMAGKIQSSRLILRHAASLLDAGDPSATVHCALAKKISTEYGSEVCNDALQLHGGYGYLNDYQIERYVRDVRVHEILEGTNQIMRHIVGRALLQ